MDGRLVASGPFALYDGDYSKKAHASNRASSRVRPFGFCRPSNIMGQERKVIRRRMACVTRENWTHGPQ